MKWRNFAGFLVCREKKEPLAVDLSICLCYMYHIQQCIYHAFEMLLPRRTVGKHDMFPTVNVLLAAASRGRCKRSSQILTAWNWEKILDQKLVCARGGPGSPTE